MNGHHPDQALEPNGQVDPASTGNIGISQPAAVPTQHSPAPVHGPTNSLPGVPPPVSPLPASAQQPSLQPPTSKIYPFQFADLKEGDLDPTLGNRIKWLISSDDNFIVSIGEEGEAGDGLYVEWNMNDCSLLEPGTGHSLNRVGQLEAVNIQYLSRIQITSYKRMIAEGVARLFENNIEAANSALDLAETWIIARNTEIARGWYLMGSGLAALVSVVLVIILGYWNQSFNPLSYYTLIVGTAFGGLGAWLSVIQRSRTAGLDVAAGKILHYLEGAFRIMAGSLGALLVAIGIRAGFLPQANRLAALMVICMVAGVSERLVPSFIEQVESRTSGGSQQLKTTKP